MYRMFARVYCTKAATCEICHAGVSSRRAGQCWKHTTCTRWRSEQAKYLKKTKQNRITQGKMCEITDADCETAPVFRWGLWTLLSGASFCSQYALQWAIKNFWKITKNRERRRCMERFVREQYGRYATGKQRRFLRAIYTSLNISSQ